MRDEQARYGRVSSVFLNSEKGAIFVNVVTGPNREPREMKFSAPKPGVWYVPQEGDMVEVHNVNGTNVARFPANEPEGFSLPNDLSEGDVCFRLNQETKLHFSVQEDGTVNVDLTADGVVNVNAPTVNVGDKDGTFKPVARQGDPISGTDSNGGSVTGQIDSGSSSVNSS
ncbi:baseplate assembly protein V [Halorubrum tailed virus 25]|uniref:Baseplate assembly protein V n=1 Tax=Halorubrum tailed virus 25 TaxID=2878006 RepID=A0AAE8XZN6_9CAUD|nr:baseplate assembly protein V [Halorubrum tailed virus 25]UBF22611.1 baseplate assembly protein V [Halorubrum tailed virus 25]